MKNKKIFYLCIIAVLMVVAWFLFSYKENVGVKPISINSNESDSPNSLNEKIDNKQNKKVLEGNKDQEIPIGLTKKGWERILEYDRVNKETNSVIDFYGKVVDQYGAGIPGVNVEFQVSGYNDNFITKILEGAKTGEVKGTFKKRIEVKSNEIGFFRINNERGQFLRVMSIRKEGYTPPSKIGEDYIYKKNYGKKFSPSPENSIIFTMWKDSLSKVDLKSFNFKINLRGDGTKRAINLIKGRLSDFISENCDILVSIKSSIGEGETLKKYDWRLLVEAVNGGLIETTDAFLFLAPETGYVDNYEVFMEKGSPEWTPSIHDRKFYFKGRKGQVYAAIKLTAYAYNRGHGVVLIDAVVNANGSRSLEK